MPRQINTPTRTFEERLALIPTDRHVTYLLHTRKCGQHWDANWTDDQDNPQKLYLGKDRDGIFAARSATQRHYHVQTEKAVVPLEHPQKHLVFRVPVLLPDEKAIVWDEEGTVLTIDEEMAFWFDEPIPKVIFCHGGYRYILFDGEEEAGMHTRYIRLEQWLFEANYCRPTEKGYEIVQKKSGNDFTVENLTEVRKARKQEDAA